MSNSNPSLLRIVVLYLLVDCVSSFSKSTFVGSSKNHFGLTNRSESNLKMVDGKSCFVSLILFIIIKKTLLLKIFIILFLIVQEMFLPV